MSGGARRRRVGIDVPDDLGLSWTCGSHLEDQRGEARSVAWCRSSTCSPSPGISRRSCGWRRPASVDHAHDDLAKKKVSGDLQEMRHDEEKREGVKGEGQEQCAVAGATTYQIGRAHV